MIEPRQSEEMKCGKCKLPNFKELIILKREGWVKERDKKKPPFVRVCWSCAKRLVRERKYNFGKYWTSFLFNLRYEEIVVKKRRGRYSE